MENEFIESQCTSNVNDDTLSLIALYNKQKPILNKIDISCKNNIQLILKVCNEKSLPKSLSLLVAAQAILETDWFKSKTFIEDNNAFGYKFVKGAKYQLGAGRISTEEDPYAKYSSLEDSVRELCDWIYRRKQDGRFPSNLFLIKSGIDYASYLKKCGYYGGKQSDYAKSLDLYLAYINSTL